MPCTSLHGIGAGEVTFSVVWDVRRISDKAHKKAAYHKEVAKVSLTFVKILTYLWLKRRNVKVSKHFGLVNLYLTNFYKYKLYKNKD